MQDVRGRAKAERQYSNEPKRCLVCGRLYTKRRTDTCSKACAERVTAGFKDSPMRANAEAAE